MKRIGLMMVVLGLFFFAQAAQADWTPTKRLTWTSRYSVTPAIAVDPSDNLHLVWSESASLSYEIFYKNSTDGGSTWTANKNLSWTAGWSGEPAIATDKYGNIHIVWMDDTPELEEYKIYYKKSTDGGATWTAGKRLTWNSGVSWKPAIAADPSGNLHMVWHDSTPGNDEIYYKKSTDGGATWEKSKRLTWTSGGSCYPAISIDSKGNPNAVWDDDTSGNPQIYYRRSVDGGETWTASKRFIWTSEMARTPAIAADSSGNLHVIWWEGDWTPGNFDIYYKKSADGGTTWSTRQRLTWTSGHSEEPAIAADSLNNLHVVWEDYTPGNYEIYYKKFIN